MLILLPLAAKAATLDVCATCTYTTVGDAVAAASSGDTIQVAAGVYDETDLVINMSLTLIGAGSDVTTLRSDSAQVMYLGSPSNTYINEHALAVSGFDLQPSDGGGVVVDHVDADFTDIRISGASDTGIAIYETSSVTVAGSTFEGLGAGAISDRSMFGWLTVTRSSFDGSGISGSDVRVEGCTFAYAGISAYRSLESADNTFSGGRAIYAGMNGSSSGDTFTGHSADKGAAIYSTGSFSVDDAVFTGNSATVGADVYAEVSVLISDSTISGSSGGSVSTGFIGAITLSNVTATDIVGACAFYSGADSNGITATGSDFSDIDGNAICTSHAVWTKVTDCTFSNVSGTAVRAASASELDVVVSGSTFTGNGTGVSLWPTDMGSTSSISVSNSTFSGHTGAAVSAVGNVQIRSCTFSDNAAGVSTGAGSSSHLVPATNVSDSDFSRNGTAVSAAGDVEIDRCTFTDNTTAVAVSGVWRWSGTEPSSLDASDSMFSGHTSSAIQTSDASVDVYDCTFEGNSAPDAGGAISITTPAGDATVLRNRFCGNDAETGGAVWLDSASVTLSGSGNVFADNTAATAGGDLYLRGAASLVNNTFVGGYAPTGGGVWSEADLDFRNNVVAFTSDYGLYGSGGTATIAYNDFWEVAPDAVGGTWPAPDGTNLAMDPMFASYVEGGCEELDLGLLGGSALYDAGDPSTTDEDGTRADIGATGGETPADGTRRWYLDADGDGHGVPVDVAYGPTAPAGYAATTDDCDDADPDRYPGNRESCDGVDEDCDGAVDESVADAPSWRQDADGDGYQGIDAVESCDPPGDGWEPVAGEIDCDDADPTVHPGAVEICDDGIDQDCDDDVDEGPIWRPDADGDGFPGEGTREACDAPEGWIPDDGGAPEDCNDEDPDVFPGAEEPPGPVDYDCDGFVRYEDEEGGCKGCSSAAPDPGWALLLAFAALRTRRSGRALRGGRR